MSTRRLLVMGVTAAFVGTTACAGARTAPESPAAADSTPSDVATTPISDELTPAMRYWQIEFLLGITEGVDGDLAEALQARYGAPDGSVPTVPDLAAFQGAGYRIASAESILDGLSDLAAFRQTAEADLLAERDRLLETSSVTIDALDPELLAEEILIVRSAALDSLEALAAEGAWPADLVDGYRVGTLQARNELEYTVFAREMDALADHNIEESAGRIDAFHRMLDDSNDTAFLRERVMAAEEMSRQINDEHREYATRRTIRTLIFVLPALSSYFRYR
ncbi:MAG: hypothetical protein AAGH19_09505 [Pseudomonadota bacterium]